MCASQSPAGRRLAWVMVAACGGDEVPFQVIRFPYDGTIDAEGQVLEPAWLWEEHLEAAHRPRARRIRMVRRLYGIA